jgi:hypothetical protein
MSPDIARMIKSSMRCTEGFSQKIRRDEDTTGYLNANWRIILKSTVK